MKSTVMKKDPISSIVLFYVFSVPCIFIFYVFFGLTTQAGAQIPLLIIGLSALWLPLIGTMLCLYFLLFFKQWTNKDRMIMIFITLGHFFIVYLGWSQYW
jgi:hypothetical protein